MTIKTTTQYFCDICGKEMIPVYKKTSCIFIKNDDEHGTWAIEYANVCTYCFKSVHNLINQIKENNDERK